ncbi:MAG: hypothetical protein HGB10_04950 [Coriobacteriia bacterium]|nr:hypothetical protein [Coriobacteriia bacterium]
MKRREGDTPSNTRRMTVVAGTAAAAVLCMSLAFASLFGSAPAAAPSLSGPSIATTSSHPIPPGAPHAPHRKPLRPVLSVKLAEGASSAAFADDGAARTAAALHAAASIPRPIAHVCTISEAASSLLHLESKASRTRGQPGRA